ncbi:STAS/SEC14 domain-containing protein [Hyphomicrobiales bacterium]|nr:STAS/SEC14 domain-containing protein [Hyphomicrobiales bacterium]CAH1699623.1 STAS/SEC14 domain-containing protein [Hyphomicrobiales bacterium]CAI0343358.1 STAS/SEC14 domain-containing protein [Hyphomicrobiales bacterium]
MLQIDLLEDEGIVTLTPHGPLRKADFERLSGIVDPYINAEGSLKGLMVDAASFPGWDGIGALMSHLEFVMGHHSKVERVAIVSDSELLKFAPHVAKHFVAADIRRFPANEKAGALAWLKESSA